MPPRRKQIAIKTPINKRPGLAIRLPVRRLPRPVLRRLFSGVRGAAAGSPAAQDAEKWEEKFRRWVNLRPEAVDRKVALEDPVLHGLYWRVTTELKAQQDPVLRGELWRQISARLDELATHHPAPEEVGVVERRVGPQVIPPGTLPGARPEENRQKGPVKKVVKAQGGPEQEMRHLRIEGLERLRQFYEQSLASLKGTPLEKEYQEKLARIKKELDGLRK